MRKRTKKYILAFLLGVFATLIVGRWMAIEKAQSLSNLRVSYIEGFLERLTEHVR